MNRRLLFGIVFLFVGGALIFLWASTRSVGEPEVAAVQTPIPPAFELAQADIEFPEDEEPPPPPPTPEPAPPANPGEPVVYVLRDLPAGARVSAEDVNTQPMLTPPPSTFRSIDDVVGRILTQPIPSGSLLNDSAFRETTSPISERLLPGERAVAISIDEVIGGGGFLRPGDSVDVLLYISGASNNSGHTQTVISGARLLSYGAALEFQDGNEPGAGRTAVVAVHADLVNRLVLAEQEGRLRLAARPLDSGAEEAPRPAYMQEILPPSPTPQPAATPTVPILRGGGNR